MSNAPIVNNCIVLHCLQILGNLLYLSSLVLHVFSCNNDELISVWATVSMNTGQFVVFIKSV